jgi:hypothetical protein
VVTFHLIGPAAEHGNLRRTGPPPQRFGLRVPAGGAEGQIWTLKIGGLPSQQDAEGRIVIRLPESEPPAPPPAEPQALAPESQPSPWRQARPMASGLGPELTELFRGVERLRVVLVDEDPGRRDAYLWQDDLLRYLVDQRDALARGEAGPSEATLKLLGRMAGLVRRIDDLRNTTDPILAGPPPEDPDRRRAWQTLRRQAIDPLEHELDRLLHDLQEGYVPELQRELWPPRLLSCVTACERHFEQRSRIGAARTGYGAVALEQWDRVLAAAAALERLVAVPPVTALD